MKKIFKQDEFRELGFGNRVVSKNQRLMNRDGSSNVKRKGLSYLRSLNFYHYLITISWIKFSFLVVSSYVLVNLLFATVYYVVDADHINGMVYHTPFEKFLEVFFFSAQSLTTVGYGRLNPEGIFSSTVAAIESMIGLLGFALATGLLYGRFSRPVAKILFSENAIIAPYKGITGLMFRIANGSKSELIDTGANVIFSYVVQEDGKPIRKFSNLKLELTKITILSMSWTIVHPIDEESPIYQWSVEDLTSKDVEILVLLQAYDETFAQTVHARTSYRHEEIISGAKFNPVIDVDEEGSVIVALDRLNDFTRVNLEAGMQKLA